MKKITFSLFLLLLVTACGSNSESSTDIEKQITELTEQKKKKEKKEKEKPDKKKIKLHPYMKMQEDIQHLSELEPTAIKELKAWLPTDIEGFKRTSFKGGGSDMLAVSSIEATWENGDNSKSFEIELIDGAGGGATSVMGMQMALSQEIEEESEYEIRKTTEREGIRVLEDHKFKKNKTSIQFIKNDRYYISVKGMNMSIDETWEFSKQFDFDNLK